MTAVSGPTTAPSLIQYDVDHSRSFEGIAAALKIAAATKETVEKNGVQQYQAVALLTPGGVRQVVHYAKSDYDAISERLQSSVDTLRSLGAVMELGGNRGDARVLIERFIHTPRVGDSATIRKGNARPAAPTGFEIHGFGKLIIPDIFWNIELFAGAKILYILVADLFIPQISCEYDIALKQFVDAEIGREEDFKKLLEENRKMGGTDTQLAVDGCKVLSSTQNTIIRKRVKEVTYTKIFSKLSDPTQRQQILKDVTMKQMVAIIHKFLIALTASQEEFNKEGDLTPYLFLIYEMNSLNHENQLYGLRMAGRPIQETNDYLHAEAALARCGPLPRLSAAASHTQFEEQNMELAGNIEEAIIDNLSRLHRRVELPRDAKPFFTQKELAFMVVRSLLHDENIRSAVRCEDVLSFIPSAYIEMLNRHRVQIIEFYECIRSEVLKNHEKYAELPQCDFKRLCQVPTLSKLGLNSARIKDLRFLKDLPNIKMVEIGPHFIGNVKDWEAQLAFLKEARPDLKFVLLASLEYQVDLKPLKDLTNVTRLMQGHPRGGAEEKYEREQREFLEKIRPELFT